MDFTQTQVALSNLYGGAASRNAETFQGRIDRLKQGFDEAKESIGTALLPIIERFIGYLFEYGVPIVNKFKDGWNTVKTAIDNNRENFQAFIDLMQDYVLPILGKVFGFLVDVGAKAAAAIISAFGTILGAVTPIINFIIDAINTVIRGINLIKPGADIGYLNKIGQPSSNFQYNQGNPLAGQATPTSVSSGSVTSQFTAATGGATVPKIDSPIINGMRDMPALFTSSGEVTGRGLRNLPPETTGNITVNIGVAGDPEATARVLVDTLNNSFYRGTRGAGLLAGIQ
jgi:hypothetical protein